MREPSGRHGPLRKIEPYGNTSILNNSAAFFNGINSSRTKQIPDE